MEYPAYLSIGQLCVEVEREGTPYGDDPEILEEIQELVEHLQRHQLLPQVASQIGARETMATVLYWLVDFDACASPKGAVPMYRTPRDSSPIQWASSMRFQNEFSTKLLIRRADLAERLSFNHLQGPRFWGLYGEEHDPAAWFEEHAKRLTMLDEIDKDITALQASRPSEPKEIVYRRKSLDRLRKAKEDLLAQARKDDAMPPAQKGNQQAKAALDGQIVAEVNKSPSLLDQYETHIQKLFHIGSEMGKKLRVYLDAHAYSSSNPDLARKYEVSERTITNWIGEAREYATNDPAGPRLPPLPTPASRKKKFGR